MSQKRLHLRTRDIREKEVRRLYRKYNEIGNAAAQAVQSLKLDKPIRNGFKKFFVVEDHIKKHPLYSKIANEVLPLIQSTIYCKNIDFQYWNWKDNKYEDMDHKLRVIHAQEWSRKKMEQSKLAPYFVKYFTHNLRWEYYFKYEEWFCPVIKRHHNTHYRVPNGELESQEKRVRNYINTHHLRPAIDKMLYGHCHVDRDYRGCIKREKRNLAVKEMREEIAFWHEPDWSQIYYDNSFDKTDDDFDYYEHLINQMERSDDIEEDFNDPLNDNLNDSLDEPYYDPYDGDPYRDYDWDD